MTVKIVDAKLTLGYPSPVVAAVALVKGCMSPEDSLYKQLGERLRVARKDRGLTQDQVAAAIALERTSITNIESGRQRLPLHTLYQYCNLLGIEVAAILPPVRLQSKQELPVTIGQKTVVVSSSVAQVIGRRFGNGGVK